MILSLSYRRWPFGFSLVCFDLQCLFYIVILIRIVLIICHLYFINFDLLDFLIFIFLELLKINLMDTSRERVRLLAH